MRDSVYRCQRQHAVARFQYRSQRDKVRGGHAVQYDRAVLGGIGAHVLQRVRLRFSFEALEERHVARQMRDIFIGNPAAAIHAG